MATVIDALVVTLGLDPKGVQKGQKDASTAMGKVSQSVQTMGKGIDAAGRSGAQAIRSLSREAVAFFAVLTAGKSLKAFVQDNTSANVALGNLSRNIGVSAQSLGAWQNVARSFGGTAEDVSGSMQSLVSQFQTVEGRTNLGVTFRQMGVRLQGANGQLRDMNEMLPDLARSAQRLGPQIFSALGSQAGFSQGFINMLEQGPGKIEAMYASLKKYAPTKEDTQASGQLMMDWVKLTAQSEAFGRTIMTSLTPELHDMMQWVSSMIDQNQGWIRQDIPKYAKEIGDAIKGMDWKSVGDAIKKMWDYLRSVDWEAVGKEIKDIGSSIDSVVKSTTGWTTALEALFALWVGSKFVGAISAVRQFAAITNLGATGAQTALGIGEGVLGGVVATGASAAFATYEGVKAAQEIDHDMSDEGKQEHRRDISKRNDKYYSSHRYTLLEQNQIQHDLYGYGVNDLHRDPKEVAAMLAQFKVESGFNPQAIGDGGSAIGLAQWHPDREKWIEQRSGKSLTSMDAREQMKWAFTELDQRYKGVKNREESATTVALATKELTTGYEGPADKVNQPIMRAALADIIYANETGQKLRSTSPKDEVRSVATGVPTPDQTPAQAAAKENIPATESAMHSADDNSVSNSTVNNNSHITGNYHMVINGADPATTRQAVVDAHNRTLARQANHAFSA
ncbi:phage tail tape measure protein [Komagataeibacter europaeus]|uniref:phage tail tape measure protein n=1 Tax=Komagataeibacter europaeus TaxID=33995 RepID=UPI000237E087|nr:phage tail tape measure protein [Komagataeibacter europaeus]